MFVRKGTASPRVYCNALFVYDVRMLLVVYLFYSITNAVHVEQTSKN